MSHGIVAVTGANGFIGRHLVSALLTRGSEVRALVRRPEDYDHDVEVKRADVLDEESLRSALEGVSIAYYLIHSMKNKGHEFVHMDRVGAENFLHAAENAGVK